MKFLLLALVSTLIGCEAYYNPETGVAVLPAYYVSTGEWPHKERFGRFGVDMPPEFARAKGLDPNNPRAPGGHSVLASARYNQNVPGSIALEGPNAGFNTKFKRAQILYPGDYPPMHKGNPLYAKDLKVSRQGGRVFLRRK